MGCLQSQEWRFYELGYGLARWTGQMHIQPYINSKLDNFLFFYNLKNKGFSEPGYGLAQWTGQMLIQPYVNYKLDNLKKKKNYVNDIVFFFFFKNSNNDWLFNSWL